MKKILITVLILLLSIFIPANTVLVVAAPLPDVGVIGALKDIEYSNDGVNGIIAIHLSTYSNYNVFRLANPDRIVIDFNNVRLYSGLKERMPNGNVTNSLRFGQFEPKVSRVVLETKGQAEYRIEEKPGVVYIYVPSNSVDSSGNNWYDKDNSDTSGNTGRDNDNVSRGDVDREIESAYKDLKITYSGGMDSDQVSIPIGKKAQYNVMRLTGQERVVIDIEDIDAPVRERIVNVGSRFIRTIRYARLDSKTARVVLDINSQLQYDVSVKKNNLIIDVQEPVYRNTIYSNSGDRVFFSLKGAKLGGGESDSKPSYTETYSNGDLKYTITFPSNLANLGSGILNINDGLIESVEIKQDARAGLTSVEFNSKEKLKYMITTKPGMEDTTITLLKPVSIEDRLVVIDAGHGGSDPGAVHEGIMEKDLNLDIAKRLNELLNEKNIKTYMIREDDSFVGLQERAGIANNLNATLFISIHNNAMFDKSYDGTMTLYYPPRSTDMSFNGKWFAQIIQKNMLSHLGTTDRKIIERPNLVVLNSTKMPAALAEVAFMTNAKDRNNLMKSSFRQDAAKALCDGIIQALEAME